jgi:hypothetical protein
MKNDKSQNILDTNYGVSSGSGWEISWKKK